MKVGMTKGVACTYAALLLAATATGLAAYVWNPIFGPALWIYGWSLALVAAVVLSVAVAAGKWTSRHCCRRVATQRR